MVGDRTQAAVTRHGSAASMLLGLLVLALLSLQIYLLMLYSTLAQDLVQLLFVFTSTSRSTSTPLS